MEGLILVLLQALVAVIAPGLTAIAAFLASLAGLIGALLAFALQSVMSRPPWRSAGPPAPSSASGPAPAPPHAPRRGFSLWTRRILIASMAATLLLLAGLVTLNQWFLGDAARALLERVRARTGIAITAREIGGDLFSGRFHAQGIVISRSGHDDSDLALTVRSLEVRVPVWRVLTSTIVIDSALVSGVRGSIVRGLPLLAPVPSASAAAPGDQSRPAAAAEAQPTPTAHRPKRRFEIASLDIADVDVTYADRTRRQPLVLAVTMEALSVHPLRSRWAVSDLLFRANANGTINGRSYRIASAGADPGGTADWSADGLPAALLASQIGGPFALLRDGSCDLTVHSHWREAPEGRVVVMDWSLVLDHLAAAPPDRLTPMLAELAKPAIAYFNAAAPRLPLAFTAEIPEDRFDGVASWDAAGAWQLVGDACAVTLAQHLGLDPDRIKALGRSAAGKAREALDRWRGKPSP